MSVPEIQDEVITLCQAGHALALCGGVEQALREYERALALDPRCAPALFNRGTLLLRSDRATEALECFEHLAAMAPAIGAVHLARGNALAALGRQASALACFEEAIRCEPAELLAHCNRGNALVALGRAPEALASLDRAAALAPANALVRYNRGNALLALTRYAEALADFDIVVQADPRFVLAWYNRGSALLELCRHADAVASFERVVALAPDYAPAHNNRGAALLCLKRRTEAIEAFEQALRLQPGYDGALENLGKAFHHLARFDEAARCFGALAAASPERPYALGNLLDAQARCCDWGGDYPTVRARVADAVARGQRVQFPFAFLATCDSAAAQLECARIYAADKFPRAAEPLWSGRPYRHDRIRVAYLSADFRYHATAVLTAELLERHDRRSFEWTAISFGPDDGSPLRRRLERAFAHFVEGGELSDHEIAALIRDREIDIAVDLQGYTADCRAGIFAHRPAPVQVNYLAYPGTLGSPCMDYLIADRRVIPREHFPFYSEKVVHLPHCYQPNGSGREVAPTAPSRAQASLPERGFVFCSFNGSYKIIPEVFDRWMRLLRALPESVLWLLDDNEAATRNLRREAAARQVEPERLVFAPRVPLAVHLARYPLADLFLDTLPCNAHTTASDALWSGVPVLTCLGTTFAGRVAASVLEAAGLPELVAGNLDEYEALALALASDPGRLSALRARLAAQRPTCALFDIERYRRGLEAAYTLMWQRVENHLPPIAFAVHDRSITGA
jgi:predicted O-linked N-acetylglucosamine transferase (SPINDLY family)